MRYLDAGIRLILLKLTINQFLGAKDGESFHLVVIFLSFIALYSPGNLSVSLFESAEKVVLEQEHLFYCWYLHLCVNVLLYCKDRVERVRMENLT